MVNAKLYTSYARPAPYTCYTNIYGYNYERYKADDKFV